MNTKMFTLGKIQSYKNMPDLITEALKDAILQGEYKGGAQLKQDEIAKQFDVSLIPVREALIQLEAKGLVNCIRNKGTVVTHLNLKEMHELFELRSVLEVGSIYLMEGPIASDHLNKLKYLIEKMSSKVHTVIYCRHYRLFYQLFCDTAQNEELSQMYEDLFVRIERYLMYIYHVIPELMDEQSHQEQIVRALEEGRKEELIHYIQSHIKRVEEDFLNHLKKEHISEQFDWNSLLPFKSLEIFEEI